MVRILFRLILFIGWLGFSIGCEAAPATVPAPSAPVVTAPDATVPSTAQTSIRPAAATETSDSRFKLSVSQAELVQIVVAFIHAYNDGRVGDALALLDEQIVGSDCDYTSVTTLFFKGKREAEAWLRQRIADADQLTIERILNENPAETQVAGLVFARRTSNTLRGLGFARGITPKVAAKVIVSYAPTRITAFANGPGGGDQSQCRA